MVFDGDIKKLKINYNPNKDYVDISKLYKKIFTGGLPKIVSTKINRNNYYMDYINTYLERDIKELSQVGHLDTFYDFLVYMAARTSNELKYEEISKNLGISAPTLYLSHILIILLRGWLKHLRFILWILV